MKTNARLIVMNFLQYAVWGAYLTSMGSFLAKAGLGQNIGFFYSMQGVVSLITPALMGIIADRWVPAQKLLGICHALSAIFMFFAGYYALEAGNNIDFTTLFACYSLSVAFYMPTIALSNSVAYSVLSQKGMNTVKHFPFIRIFGTIGFIIAMLAVNFIKSNGIAIQHTPIQFLVSGDIGIVLAIYAFTLPNCKTNTAANHKTLAETLGLNAFSLFNQKKMAVFFIFSMLLGASLQITNGYANPFITGFADIPEFATSWGAQNANALISLSQFSETVCILLIPFCLRRFGIKKVMLISMFAWVFRFGLFGMGNPGSGVWLFVLSMIVYGVAFDFFNISGSLFVDQETTSNMRSSAQGLFMMMTNGFGATIGTLGAQFVVNHFVYSNKEAFIMLQGWKMSWYIFAAYALVVAILFAVTFKYKQPSGSCEK